MTPEKFKDCVAAYCTATGASAAVAETLVANYRSIVTTWKCTLAEIMEVASRLVSRGRIPTWANEHLKAIGLELDEIRSEVRLRSLPPENPNECNFCKGIGWIIVPHPCCIYRGKVEFYYNPTTKERRQAVLTMAVLCDNYDCRAGASAQAASNEYADSKKKPRCRTFSNYTNLIGGHDGIAALNEWDSELAARMRAEYPRSESENDTFRSLMANILKRESA